MEEEEEVREPREGSGSDGVAKDVHTIFRYYVLLSLVILTLLQ